MKIKVHGMVLSSITFVTNEIVNYVSGIVDTETHCNDQGDARHHLYGQAPEVDKSYDIDLKK